MRDPSSQNVMEAATGVLKDVGGGFALGTIPVKAAVTLTDELE